jgi:hypothetical protein
LVEIAERTRTPCENSNYTTSTYFIPLPVL